MQKISHAHGVSSFPVFFAKNRSRPKIDCLYSIINTEGDIC
ncbi:hypothetical protein E6C60_3439 [Paenibacillus algicola]|uniref:Uncharacterized protein n=1 Tax=Paenibacillus algicola TaxID=2565926 RepID=A0A4P8XQM5_9BACL|nr:hypothetical protein E6C60_3439 [Paenibacillus algicola]